MRALAELFPVATLAESASELFRVIEMGSINLRMLADLLIVGP